MGDILHCVTVGEHGPFQTDAHMPEHLHNLNVGMHRKKSSEMVMRYFQTSKASIP
jgi:hypothetical protein